MIAISTDEVWLLNESEGLKDSLESITRLVAEENWKEIFELTGPLNLISHITDNGSCDEMETSLICLVKEIADKEKANRNELFVFGVVCLKLFFQANWTGPPLDVSEVGKLSQLLQSEHINEGALEILNNAGEDAFSVTAYPILILIASTILIHNFENLSSDFFTVPLWGMRCLFAINGVMERRTIRELKHFDLLSKKVAELGILKNLPNDVVVEYYLLCSHLELDFYRYEESRKSLDKAVELDHIKVSLTGSLGRRTKFQEEALAQLRLEVQVEEDREVQCKPEILKNLPTDIVLEHEVLLPNVVFVDPLEDAKISAVDEAVIMSLIDHIKRTEAKDAFHENEVMSYVDYVLRSPQSWAIQYKALVMRCMVEKDTVKKMERSLAQFEDLTNLIEKPEPLVSERLPHLHSINFSPAWETKRSWGHYLFSFGSTNGALDIFLAQHLWEDVITCYARLGRHEKAEEVIRKQLEIKETPSLYCHLGDATLDIKHYDKAWELSRERSARAQRSLGLHYLRKGEFAECIPALQKSLELNFLQPDIWFSCGCAAMKTGDHKLAIQCFQSCVSIDHENAHGWANLASNFIATRQLEKAHGAMQHSLTLSWDDWKLWENYFLLCIDFRAFNEAIQSVHRLVDLRRKIIDAQALTLLVSAIMNNQLDNKKREASVLLPKLYQLFGHITSSITDSSVIWDLYASLSLNKNTSQDTEQGLLHMYKSLRCYLQNTEWEKHEKGLPHVMHISSKLIDITKDVCEDPETRPRASQHLNSTKMSITNLILRLQKSFVDENGNLLDTVKPHIASLEESISDLTKLAQQIK